MTTTLLRDGIVHDGMGTAPFEGHLLLDGDRIAALVPATVGPVPEADVIISAKGKAVAPGLIDMHSHLDWVLAARGSDELLRPFLEQGVSTVVAGNCGISPAPFRRKTIDRLEGLARIAIERPLDYDWDGMAGLLEHIDAGGPAVNMAQLVGHAAVRYARSDVVRGTLPPEALADCLDETARCLDAGCCGLSLGLGYDPGTFSPLEELEAFASTVARTGKLLTVHLKAYSRLSPCYPLHDLRPHNLRALGEVLDLALRTGVRLQISHLIFVGKRSWPLVGRALEMIEQARDRGLDVRFDAFPFTCGNTTVDAAMPEWFLKGLPAVYQSRIARLRLQLEATFGFGFNGTGFEDFVLMHAGTATRFEEHCGLTMQQIGERLGWAPLTVALEISRASGGSALVLIYGYGGIAEEERTLETVLSHDLCLYESDSVTRAAGIPNPALRGTFPKLLSRAFRRRLDLSLETAIHRMTGASAERFGLEGRGRLAEGAFADVLVFDPETIRDVTPDDGGPAGRPRGIERLFVNGEQVVVDGRALERRGAGRVLRV